MICIDEKICVGCGKCVDICPGNLLTLKNSRAAIRNKPFLGVKIFKTGKTCKLLKTRCRRFWGVYEEYLLFTYP